MKENLSSTSHPELAVDSDGQPANHFLRATAVKARQIDELIGLIKGVLADGAICQQEIEFLLAWLSTNKAAQAEWPATVLYPRITAALSDGHMDTKEEFEIMELLLMSVGGNKATETGNASNSTSLPLCNPKPAFRVPGKTFCFTGKFHSGTRPWCQNQVTDRGGLSSQAVTQKLNFLVIGEIGSRDWLHSTHGTKIKKAVEYRDKGIPLHIINERYWHEQIMKLS